MASATFVDAMRSVEGFAGAYYDHGRDGALVLLLVDPSAETIAAIRAKFPPDAGELIIEDADRTHEALVDAAKRLWDLHGDLLSSMTVYEVALDTPQNMLVVSVPEAELASADAASPAVSEALGVPVRFGAGVADHEAACTSRTNCTSPMRGGIEIRKGSSSGTYHCTMSFHVMSGGDGQFLTAGHCGYSGSNYWYHPGYGSSTIGAEVASLYTSGIDAMRVSLVQYQDSNRVYTNQASNFVTMNAAIGPVIGQVVRISGAAGGWRGGTITSDWTSWTGEACGCTQWGADASYTTVGGDSGGPVLEGSATTGSRNGIGIGVTANGHMAILLDALDGLAATLKT
jgi:hypothetical protein